MAAITDDGPLPYAELARRLDLEEARVREVVATAEAREVLKRETADADLPQGLTAGLAPATKFIKINSDAGYVIGINVGRTYWAVGVADPNGILRSTESYPKSGLSPNQWKDAWRTYQEGQITVKRRLPGVNGRSLLRAVAKETRTWIESLGIRPDKIRGATISLPAPVSKTQSRLLTHAIEGQLGVVENVETEFMDALGREQFSNLNKVILANDADVAARGEIQWGDAYGRKDIVAIHAAYGIGAGVISDGRIIRTGAGGGVGEVGHIAPRITRDEGAKAGLIPLDPAKDEYICACDCHGHLEGLAGGEAIIKRLRASLPSLVDTPPAELADQLLDSDATVADQLDALLATIAGDLWTPGREAVLDAAHMVGGAVHTVAHLFHPEAVYLCGKLSEMGEPFLRGVEAGFEELDTLEGFKPLISLGTALTEFDRRLIMVKGAAMTAVRGTPTLITPEDLLDIEWGRPELTDRGQQLPAAPKE